MLSKVSPDEAGIHAPAMKFLKVVIKRLQTTDFRAVRSFSPQVSD
jgi:hypothetical protein